jgi:hypothetical protein
VKDGEIPMAIGDWRLANLHQVAQLATEHDDSTREERLFMDIITC